MKTKLFDKMAILVVILAVIASSLRFVSWFLGMGDTNEHAQWGMIFMIGAWVCVLQIRIDNLTK